MRAQVVSTEYFKAPRQASAAMLDAGAQAVGIATPGVVAQVAVMWGAMCEAVPAPRWSSEPPVEQGWYWHWNGDPECRPLPTSVLYSGSTKSCFVSANQLGLKNAVDCSEYGGFWLPLLEPDTGAAENAE